MRRHEFPLQSWSLIKKHKSSSPQYPGFDLEGKLPGHRLSAAKVRPHSVGRQQGWERNRTGWNVQLRMTRMHANPSVAYQHRRQATRQQIFSLRSRVHKGTEHKVRRHRISRPHTSLITRAPSSYGACLLWEKERPSQEIALVQSAAQPA